MAAMRNVIADLRTEHTNMERLLKVLDRQIEIFEAAGQPDYTLMQDIILYFLDFPDQCHHPKEDLLAQRLLELSPDRAARLSGLSELHKELGVLTRKVASVVRRVLDEAELPRAQVIGAATDFMSAQRHHMEMEEEHFLPLAEEVLSETDLGELQSEIFNKDDPLFGSGTEEHFAMLSDSILKWEQIDSQS
jgi:hemerythrin-like domain-containing protein